jgi:hypothetical protein
MAQERFGVGRACPHCGVRSDTLGGMCPACRKPYVTRGLLERVPLLAVVGLVVLAGAWVWLVISHPVAGIITAGVAFGLLVGAIGVTNALADRGR